jgi:transposase-like protein
MPINHRQAKAIPILLSTDSIEAAAKQAGVTKNTLYSWLKQQDFDKALSDSRKKLLDKALEKLTGISMKAVNTLEQLLSAESEAVRRAAANDVLGHALKYRELSEIEARLESVEKIILEKRIYR